MDLGEIVTESFIALQLKRAFTVPARPDDQVPVVGHDAVGQEPGPRAFERLFQDPLERLIVLVALEDGYPGIGAVQDMENQAPLVSSSRSSHGGEVNRVVFPHPHGIQGTSVVPGLRRQTSNAPNRASNWKRRRTVSNSRENSAERPSKQVGSHRTTDAPVVVSRAAASRATSEAMRYIPKQFESTGSAVSLGISLVTAEVCSTSRLATRVRGGCVTSQVLHQGAMVFPGVVGEVAQRSGRGHLAVAEHAKRRRQAVCLRPGSQRLEREGLGTRAEEQERERDRRDSQASLLAAKSEELSHEVSNAERGHRDLGDGVVGVSDRADRGVRRPAGSNLPATRSSAGFAMLTGCIVLDSQ